MRFAPGFDASEQVVGTNGVGTALAERGPVYVVGREHFADCLQPFACAGTPVRNPLSGHIEAVLDLTCLRDDGDPPMLRLVRTAARDIEARLPGTGHPAGAGAARRIPAGRADADGWPPQPAGTAAGAVRRGAGARLGRIDLAVLREKAEELIAAPHRTLDEVMLSGGRSAMLLRRQVRERRGRREWWSRRGFSAERVGPIGLGCRGRRPAGHVAEAGAGAQDATGPPVAEKTKRGGGHRRARSATSPPVVPPRSPSPAPQPSEPSATSS